jgi:serine/threonine-protein kinase
MAEAHSLRGEVLHTQGDHAAAMRDYSEAIRLKPDDGRARHNRAKLLLLGGEWKEAITELSTVLQREPDQVEARVERGEAYQQDGQYARAIADLNAALLQEPDNARGCQLLAWLLGACPEDEHRNGPRALVLARLACQLSKEKEPAALAALACASAECGLFDDAVAWQQKALDLVPPQDRENYTAFLELYRNRKPYRLTRR